MTYDATTMAWLGEDNTCDGVKTFNQDNAKFEDTPYMY